MIEHMGKGDILLLNDDGTSLQGNINHGGMYDGTGMGYSIYTAEPGDGTKWESTYDWRNHDHVWKYTLDQAKAFDYAREKV